MESPNNCKHSIGQNPQPFVAEAFRWETCWRSHQGPRAFSDSSDGRLQTHCSFSVPSQHHLCSQSDMAFCSLLLSNFGRLFPCFNSLRSYKTGLIVRIQQDNVYKAAGIQKASSSGISLLRKSTEGLPRFFFYHLLFLKISVFSYSVHCVVLFYSSFFQGVHFLV